MMFLDAADQDLFSHEIVEVDEAQLGEIGSPLSAEADEFAARGHELLAQGELERASACFQAAVNTELAAKQIEDDLARWADDGGPVF